MTHCAIEVTDVWKTFRLYKEKNQYLKAAVLRGRRARYEEFWALKGVDFDVLSGSTLGIIGSNGSGKSTLLKCLAGILTPDKGQIQVSGRLSALLELGAGFHLDLTGRENVFLNGAILGLTRREVETKFDDIVEFAGLGKFIDTPVKNYSSGMIIRLGFAVAANVEPEILLIDEVLSVGDQSFQIRCIERIEKFRKDGCTIVFVSHALDQVRQLCEEAIWIDKGVVKQKGSALEVISNYSSDSHQAVEKVDSDLGERWGSGQATITNVDILNQDGNSSRLLETGKEAVIQIKLDSHLPVHSPVIGVRITHLLGTVVWGTTTRRQGVFIDSISGVGIAELRIPYLSLLEGTYDLTVYLSDSTEVLAFDHWERRIRFDVHQHDVFDEGLTIIQSTWNLSRSKN
jgi:ABC-type polysaccharide/polyol phosphate transport system ATPase subunit